MQALKKPQIVVLKNYAAGELFPVEAIDFYN